MVVFGADGTAEWRRTVRPGEIPGPVVPISIARQVRQSLNARNGIVAYQHPTQNADAVNSTDKSGQGAVADPNAENPSEFVLERDDGRTVMVTPLTPYGAPPTWWRSSRSSPTR